MTLRDFTPMDPKWRNIKGKMKENPERSAMQGATVSKEINRNVGK